jgi:hypothetical protein
MTKTFLIGTLAIGALCLSTPASAQGRPAIADQIAKAHGLEAWPEVEAIRYTFNLEAGPLKIHRSWVWEPKADRISYEGPDKAKNPVKVTYTRSQLATESAAVRDIDPAFFNDQYWLLFPFHLVWDTGATVTDAGKQKLPLGKGTGHKVSVKYPSEGGYLPGDTWDLFVGDDLRIREFAFHRGGTTKPSQVLATWTDYRKLGPLLVSLDHRGNADGAPLHLYFSDVAIKLAGSSTWVEAKK